MLVPLKFICNYKIWNEDCYTKFYERIDLQKRRNSKYEVGCGIYITREWLFKSISRGLRVCLSVGFIWFPSITHRDIAKYSHLLGECPTDYVRDRSHTFSLVSSIRNGYNRSGHLEMMEDHTRKGYNIGNPT